MRGPRGFTLCRWCGSECPNIRKLWCSKACVDEYLVRASASHARRLVYARDHGKCAICALDTGKLRGALKRLPVAKRRVVLRVIGLTPGGYVPTLWNADHIVAVVEGGGTCGLDNLRTLCLWCHRGVTRKLRLRLSARRKGLRRRPVD